MKNIYKYHSTCGSPPQTLFFKHIKGSNCLSDGSRLINNMQNFHKSFTMGDKLNRRVTASETCSQ